MRFAFGVALGLILGLIICAVRSFLKGGPYERVHYRGYEKGYGPDGRKK